MKITAILLAALAAGCHEAPRLDVFQVSFAERMRCAQVTADGSWPRLFRCESDDVTCMVAGGEQLSCQWSEPKPRLSIDGSGGGTIDFFTNPGSGAAWLEGKGSEGCGSPCHADRSPEAL